MKVSIFTPTHDAAFLPRIYDSIKDQPFDEWVVLLNNGASYQSPPDSRVRVIKDTTGMNYVGYLKGRCVALSTGDICVELDHDDLLMPDCIAELRKGFENPNVGFVYSNTIHATGDMKPVNRFSEVFGWKYRAANYQGHALDEHVSFAPTPNSISRIWFAPNHVRAFRRDAYEAVGGYSSQMRILDDLDLMCRLYLKTEFAHVDKGLYLYRVHGENTWLKFNAEIQNNVFRIHDQYIESMAMRWAELQGLRKLELGGRMYAAKGFETVDLKGADVIADLNERWPFDDGTVGVVRAYDVLEHLREPLNTMKELYRVLAPGGYALIQVPSTDGRGAFQDPTHVSFWNQNSFAYYTDRYWAQYIDAPVRFQRMRLYTTPKDENDVCWTRAHLVKLVDGLRVPGEVKI